jgi:hypothetical protein
MYQEVLVIEWVAVEETRDNFLMAASTNIYVLNSCQWLATFFLSMRDYIKSDTNLQFFNNVSFLRYDLLRTSQTMNKKGRISSIFI